MNARRRATLRSVVAAFAASGARVDRITELATGAIDALSPHRRSDLLRLLDLLWLPMKGSDPVRWLTLRTLATAPVDRLQTGFAALKRLALFLAYAESAPDSENPLWQRIGYPGPRDDRPDASVTPLPLATARNGERLRADVVVIGSGAGGAVVASAFASAGKRVIVLEAGGAYQARDFTQRELSMSELYLDAGLTSTSDLGIAILAGATLGGGTTVNWCTTLRLPERVAAEWEQQSGIATLADELRPHFDSVERRLGVGPAVEHNANNRVILDGARELGIHAEISPRNAAADCGDGCGYCGFGCAYQKKASTAATYLRDIAASGGCIYAGSPALRIETSGTRARGVVARQTDASGVVCTFSIEADLVFVCAGALRTPGLLARSGVAHPLLGKRLFLHPVGAAILEFDTPVETWCGPMQTAHSDAFNYSAGNYGAKIEAAPAHPGLAALALPWESRGKHAGYMERVRNVASLIAITRDRDPGCVDLDSEATIRYRLSPFDGDNLLTGVAGIFDLGFAAGAVRAMTLHTTPLEVERAEWTPEYRIEFLERMRSIGIAPNRQILFSAHQMGTAAMGVQREHSVVDPSGRVWGFENLLVADASVFPQSSGANPMLTIMAMAGRIAEQHGGAPGLT
jgi:choline dehydrogenase-like flavoprotein